MNCQEFNETIVDLARGEPIAEAAAAHLKGCKPCSEKLAQQCELTNRLRALSAESVEPPAGMEAALLSSFRASRRPRAVLAWPALAAAAVVLVLLAAWAVRTISRPTPAAVTTAQEKAPACCAEPEPLAPAKSETAPAPAPAKHPAASRPSKAAPGPGPLPAEMATDFFLLPYADALAPTDGGQIVRIRVSRSALRSIGFPVPDSGVAEQVDADVLLGDDMLARAIRFVNYSK